ncbi:hypothetical protein [Thermanaeromonas sp. C210]|uniref:hypothetical protein n=1 Tax=Thermanaeromonas sp. C210 TaxID=2731925 RepID=UPI00155BBF31|nr:hypothetical protein [Thermanaeromonas sp. C210]GFN23923.1 hypothetical protein TAMC210_22400 [Thermanaeromonas sp. C210]
MRPRILLLMLMVVVSLMFTGCGRGEGEKVKGSTLPANTETAQEGSLSESLEPGGHANENPGSSPDTPVHSPPAGQENKADTRTNIAGIHLWDTPEDVLRILGSRYQQIVVEEEGYYGEGQYIWKYDAGIEIVIGKDTRKVLDIVAYSPSFATNLGAKVGDSAKDVLAKYRTLYKEPQSRHGSGTLQGWFEVEDGAYLIFDFNKDDGTYVNETLKDEDKVELIKLTHSFYMD